MIFKGVAVFGLLALVCAGCATGTRSIASVNGNGGFASPMTSEVQACEGWFNATAGVCDSMGD